MVNFCSVEGCDKPVKGRGWCGTHYARWRRAQRPNPNRRQPETLRFWSKVDTSGECWIWTGSCATSGHGRFNGRRTPIPAHRYAYEISVGPIPDGLYVLHACDNPPCVRPEHLFLGTQADNMADAARKGRTARGDRSGPRLHPERMTRGERRRDAKLTDAVVRVIRARHAAGTKQVDLARDYGVCRQTIQALLLRKTWTHVD